MSNTPLGTAKHQRSAKPRFSLLFFFLLAYLVLYPYAQHTGMPYLGFRIFGLVVTLLSIYAVSFRRGFVIFALVLAGPALAQRIALPRADMGFVPVAGIILTLVFDVFIVVVIFRRVFLKEQPTTEAIFGALCIYLLVGFSFASLYGMLVAVQPHAFHLDPALSLHALPDRFDLIYYSFASLTCMGAAGITPVSDQARSMSLLEAVLGVMYLAVLISRLVGAYQSRRVSLVADASP